MNIVNVASTIYNTPYRALEIYISGCNRKCIGCHNSEIHDFNIGIPFEQWVENNLWKFTETNLIDSIWILGGDLLCQPRRNILNFCSILNETPGLRNRVRWLWTGEEIDYLFTLEIFPILITTFDYIKTGAYDKNNTNKVTYFFDDKSIELVGDNQKLYYRGKELEKVVN